MNRNGHPASLVPSHPGNTSRLSHGLYGRRRSLPAEAVEIADALMSAEHTVGLDRFAAEEIGALIVQLDRVDAALSDGKVERNGQARSLIDLRTRLSGRLERWLVQFGMTPAARAEFVHRLAQGQSLAAEIKRRQSEEAEQA